MRKRETSCFTKCAALRCRSSRLAAFDKEAAERAVKIQAYLEELGA